MGKYKFELLKASDHNMTLGLRREDLRGEIKIVLRHSSRLNAVIDWLYKLEEELNRNWLELDNLYGVLDMVCDSVPVIEYYEAWPDIDISSITFEIDATNRIKHTEMPF
jgi:hypothetical protein